MEVTLRTTVRENKSLEYAKAVAELEATRQSLNRKKFTDEVDSLILEYWDDVPITDLIQVINTMFDKDFSETTVRRRYHTFLKPNANLGEAVD